PSPLPCFLRRAQAVALDQLETGETNAPPDPGPRGPVARGPGRRHRARAGGDESSRGRPIGRDRRRGGPGRLAAAPGGPPRGARRTGGCRGGPAGPARRFLVDGRSDRGRRRDPRPRPVRSIARTSLRGSCGPTAPVPPGAARRPASPTPVGTSSRSRRTILLLASAVFGMAGCRSAPAAIGPGADAGRPVARVWIASAADTVPVRVEIARTEREQREGLRGRAHLPDGEGMLFLFEEEHPPTTEFWMYRTRVPLSVALLDAGGTIR